MTIAVLKPVSPSLIQAAAQRIIDSFWQRFRAALAAGEGNVSIAIEGA